MRARLRAAPLAGAACLAAAAAAAPVPAQAASSAGAVPPGAAVPAKAHAAASGTGWRVVATAGGKLNPGWMEAVAAPAADDAWAFGALTSRGAPDTYTSVVRHWNGRRWQRVTLPGAVSAALSGFPSTVAAASAPANVWAFTGAGAWVRFNGHRWTSGELPVAVKGGAGNTDGEIQAAVVLSPQDVWALGYYNPVSPLPYIAHYNGRHWKLTNLYLNTAIVGASVLGPKDIWAVGQDNTNVLLHFNGRSWKSESLPSRASGAYFAGVTALSDSRVWVTGDVVGGEGPSVEPGAMLWNGRTLSFDRLKAPAPIFNTVPDGHGGIWAVAQEPGAVAGFQPEIWHYSDGRWRSSHIRGGDPADFVDQFAAVPGTRSTWAVGLFKPGRLDLPAILVDGPLPG
jgi:hypothetical protein